ncbi:succinate-semialdehyde dehydrogenase (NADP+) [Angomonas deanei]|uniref:Aldehyde dehydrogenase family, putative n=1 Tax=Angomonas deanei TaxID=59799 RepID=S9WWH4_9TRYP|nr:succinate-semialdehyde dehydrogenase (NADP+) [Angomonas deanei]EPY40375.1 succinate-semialdehyde dehydrogenase (NADP+) [Angomonas deanei]CAD2213103.1 Aldehyde dehydrogenase family, putative [Angomonas deanei]|eukprot:EPY25366.1 succinate-semialdehyde dehydrogenase (NADP+) [Angomonas deanei]
MGLMAGNGVVLKVASNVVHVGEFIDECIRAGDLPDGLFAHVNVPGATAGPAFLAAGIDKLFFTGSVPVGKQLMAEAAKTLTPVCLELGGNDPMVVLSDANIERAVNCACWAGYQNAGQSCGGVERIYVDEKIYDVFLAELAKKTRALRHGPETFKFEVDIGAITTKGQLQTITTQVEEALKKGATIVAQSQPVGDLSKGYFYPATVLAGCTPDMLIVKDETFGPVLPVIPFKTEDEAVAMANNINLALTSSVFSNSGSHARKVAARLQSGVVTINDHLYSHGMAESPWGGWKESGIGRTHGYLGLKEMANVKNINEDFLPSWMAPRNLFWHPFSKSTYEMISASIGLLAPRSVGDFFSSLCTVSKHASFMFTKWKVEEEDKKTA